MTLRQKILKLAYPLLMKFRRKESRILNNQKKIVPGRSVHSLKVLLNNGTILDLEKFRGRKLLLVNTASDCGYTGQYAELQELYARTGIAVIGFPANDFKEQEKGNDEDIAQFCTVNFGVQFPLAKKSSVKKGAEQNEVFRWLSTETENGWNNKAPEWNFSKYLVNEEGVLTHYFPPSVSPFSTEVQRAIQS